MAWPLIAVLVSGTDCNAGSNGTTVFHFRSKIIKQLKSIGGRWLDLDDTRPACSENPKDSQSGLRKAHADLCSGKASRMMCLHAWLPSTECALFSGLDAARRAVYGQNLS